MEVSQSLHHDPRVAIGELQARAPMPADLVLVFGSIGHFMQGGLDEALRRAYPGAHLLGCSTAGEISAAGVEDGSCVITVIRFADSEARAASTTLAEMSDSFAAGERIGAELAAPGLRAIMVFGPGVNINGSALVDGIVARVGTDVPICGGLAGDGGAFARTWVLGDSGMGDQTIAAVGLFGDGLRFGHGSFGGWEPFGPARKVTRCENNVLFELDGESALAVYKRYLGEHARDLPSSGLLFPFAMVGADLTGVGLIRTILGIDESAGSLTLAGAIDPEGYLKLMHATSDGLVSGAEAAAEAARKMQFSAAPSLAVLVSCVGRKLVMGDRIDEEVEAVVDVFGSGATVAGFYSYGEISPLMADGRCHLHNQTMTIAWIGEG